MRAKKKSVNPYLGLTDKQLLSEWNKEIRRLMSQWKERGKAFEMSLELVRFVYPETFEILYMINLERWKLQIALFGDDEE